MAKGTPKPSTIKRDTLGRFTKGIIPSNKIILPRLKLEKLYSKVGSRKVAKEFNVSKPTVVRNLHEYNIPIRKSNPPPRLPNYWRKALCVPKSKPN